MTGQCLRLCKAVTYSYNAFKPMDIFVNKLNLSKVSMFTYLVCLILT